MGYVGRKQRTLMVCVTIAVSSATGTITMPVAKLIVILSIFMYFYVQLNK